MKRRIARKRKKEKKVIGKIVILAVLVLVVSFLPFVVKTKYWTSKSKFVVVINKGENVVVSVYDPLGKNRTDLVIPGNTQVQAAGELGTWKLGSLWKLGSDEKLGGNLITRTISKNFGFPVVGSWDELSLGDKLKISLFNILRRGSGDTVNLGSTGFLKPTTFLDGEKGYLVSKEAPFSILSLFSDQESFGKNLKAKINDSSGTYDLAVKVGRIVEVVGIKVAAITKSAGLDFDCAVRGKNKDLVKKMSLVLGCSQYLVGKAGTFDLEIDLGEKFSQEF